MTNVIYVPSYQEFLRDWNANMPGFLQDNGFEVYVPEIPKRPVISTLTYLSYLQKLDILKSLARREFDTETIIFFADAHDSTVFGIKDLLMKLNLDIPIVGFFHSGSWDYLSPYRTRHQSYWVSHMERGIIKASDRIFTSLSFHRNNVMAERCDYARDKEKMCVIGFPIFQALTEGKKRGNKQRNRIILQTENRELKDLMGELDFRCEDFDYRRRFTQYRKSKVIFTDRMDTLFNPYLLEALLFDCIPVCPDHGWYRKLFPLEVMYGKENDEQVIEHLSRVIMNYKVILGNEKLSFDFERPKERLLESLNNFQ